MEAHLPLLLLRLVAALTAWALWWRRRGQARRAFNIAVGVWFLATAAVAATGAPAWWIVAIDTAAGVWLVLASPLSRSELGALQASEAKFAAAFHHSLDSVMLTAVPSGQVLEVNPGFSRITGIPREAAIGRTTLELGLWEHIDERRRMMSILQRDGRLDGLAGDFLRQPDKRRIHGLIWGELIEVQGRSCLLTVVRDITDTRRRDEERARLIDKLAAKNRELERFAFTVAHDLRSPLQSIRGFSDIAHEDLERGDLAEIPDHLMRISGGAERLQDLLDSLLELSRAGKVIEARQSVDMRHIAADAVELLSASVASACAEIKVDPDLPDAHGDPKRLLQVMQNLLSNALSCLDSQSTARIEVGFRHAKQPVYFVADNGLGISADQLETIFGLFERGSNPSEGTGIGLALVRRIVESHGGRVWAESLGPGRGATFCFTLPSPGGQDVAAPRTQGAT